TKFNGYWHSTSLTEYNAGYFYDVTGRQSTNYNAGLHELERLGYFDRDCDGWREAPDGSTLSMTLLGPTLDDDLRKNTIATDFTVLLSNMDLDITMSVTGDPATFDVYLGMGELGLEPSAIRDLPMLADYSFGDLNAALDASDDALDMETRQTHVHEAQDLISAHVPFVPLLMYDAIEAYNRDTYGGWVGTVGGINNFWSFTNLQKIQVGSLAVSVELTELDSAGNATVTVRVLDGTGGSIEGANVELSADAGTFLSGIGTTDSLGEFQTTFTAPGVSDVTDIGITATTFLATYTGATTSTKITVHPDVSKLIVTVDRHAPILESGGSTSITMVITDQDMIPVGVDASGVYVSVDHAGVTLGDPTPVAGSPGEFTASFTGNVTTDTLFKVTVTAVMDGYDAGTGSTDVVVRSWGGVEPEQIEKIESIPDVGILAMVSVTLVALLVIAYRRREH
ncbi:MAG: Ig-like domain-containing protein, partial [Thermoplasmata archaeon]